MGGVMVKADIVEKVYVTIGFPKKESINLVEQVFETLKEVLGTGENIKITGFGNFVVKKKNSRKGRNPQTGEPITITARKVLTFKPSTLLRQAINK
jgi:integration host factor subunit alpha